MSCLLSYLALLVFVPLRVEPAEIPSVQTATTVDSVRVAEPFVVTLTVRAEEGSEVSFPDMDSTWGKFAVLKIDDVFDLPDAEIGGVRTWSRRITLDSLDAGTHTLPKIEVQVFTRGQLKNLSTDSLPIQILSSLPKPTAPEDYRPVTDVMDLAEPSQNPSWWWYGLCIAGGMVLVPMGYLLWRRRYGRRRLEASQWLSGRLERLVQQNETTAETSEWADEWLEEMTSIVHDHLAIHFQLRPEDIYDIPNRSEITRGGASDVAQPASDVWDETRQVLQEIEVVKFGGAPSSREQRRAWCDSVMKTLGHMPSTASDSQEEGAA